MSFVYVPIEAGITILLSQSPDTLDLKPKDAACTLAYMGGYLHHLSLPSTSIGT